MLSTLIWLICQEKDRFLSNVAAAMAIYLTTATLSFLLSIQRAEYEMLAFEKLSHKRRADVDNDIEGNHATSEGARSAAIPYERADLVIEGYTGKSPYCTVVARSYTLLEWTQHNSTRGVLMPLKGVYLG